MATPPRSTQQSPLLVVLPMILPIPRKERGVISEVHWIYGTAVTCIPNYDHSTGIHSRLSRSNVKLPNHSDSLPVANDKSTTKKKNMSLDRIVVGCPSQERNMIISTKIHQCQYLTARIHLSRRSYVPLLPQQLNIYLSPTTHLLVLPTPKQQKTKSDLQGCWIEMLKHTSKLPGETGRNTVQNDRGAILIVPVKSVVG